MDTHNRPMVLSGAGGDALNLLWAQLSRNGDGPLYRPAIPITGPMVSMAGELVGSELSEFGRCGKP